MLKQIGKSLQQARTARGLTQAELGALVGLPQSHISKIERGDETRVAAGFTMAQRRSEGPARFVGITSLRERFVEMRLQLLIDVVVELFDVK